MSGKDAVYSGAVRHEASLLGTAATPDAWQSTSEQDPGKKLPEDGEKCDASVVAADYPVPFVFPEG